MNLTNTAWVFGGLVLLVGGGELLVRGASRLAATFGISPLVIGLTVVAFGTSAPELAVSVKASLDGNPSIALGNVAGSNIFNILFILGICSMIAPLPVRSQLIKLDVPIMILCSIALTAFVWDGELARREGLVLITGAVIYTVIQIILSRRESKSVQEEFDHEYGASKEKDRKPWLTGLRNILFLGAGAGLLILGADWLVQGAVGLARSWGISDAIIGITIVAIGTSLPEVVTSVMATLKGERDISVGNVVGSNIYNILLILGVTGSLSPAGVPVESQLAQVDFPIMAAVACTALLFFVTGSRLNRIEGALFFGGYLGYTAFLIAGS